MAVSNKWIFKFTMLNDYYNHILKIWFLIIVYLTPNNLNPSATLRGKQRGGSSYNGSPRKPADLSPFLLGLIGVTKMGLNKCTNTMKFLLTINSS
jgi:hypothetical protein